MATGDDLSHLLGTSPATPSSVAPAPPSSEQTGVGGGSVQEDPVERILDAQGIRASSLGAPLPERLQLDLGTDPFLPTTTVEKGALAGTTAIDANTLRNKLAHARLNKRLAQHAAATGGAQVDPAVYDEWELEELNKARQDVSEYRRERIGKGPSVAGHPTPWLDTDTDTHAAFRNWVAEGGPTGSALLDWNPLNKIAAVRKASAPLGALMMGSKQEVFQEGTEGLSETVTYNEDDAWGFLDWSGRFSAFNMLATTMAAAGETDIRQAVNPAKWGNYVRTWGSPEHLKLVQQGEDLFSLADDLNLGSLDPVVGNMVSGALEMAGIVSEEQAEGIDDVAGAFMLSLFDPDVLTLATAGAAKAPKLMQKGAKVAADAIPGARKLESLPGAVMEALRGGDIYGTNLVRLGAKAEALEGVVKGQRAVLENDLAPKAKAEILRQHMAELAEVAPQLPIMLQRVGAALSGRNAPVTEATFRAHQKAREAGALVSKQFGEAIEAKDAAAKTAKELDSEALQAGEPGVEWTTNHLEHEVVVLVDPKKVMADYERRAAAGEVPKLERGKKTSSRTGLDERVAGGLPIQAPQLSVTDAGIDFSNGRHRTLWSAENGLRSIPVVVPSDELAAMAKYKATGPSPYIVDAEVEATRRRLLAGLKSVEQELAKVGAWGSMPAKDLELSKASFIKELAALPPRPTKAASKVTKAQKSRAHLDAELKASILQNMADEMLVGDLVSQRKAMARLLQGGKASGKAAADGSLKTYETALMAAQDALVDVAAARTPDALEAAHEAYNAANTALQGAALGVSDQAASHALARIDALTRHALDTAQLSADAVATTAKKLQAKSTKGGKAALKKELAAHSTTIRRINARTSRMGAEKAHTAALIRAGETLAKGYRGFAKGAAGADDGAVALAKAAEREATSTYMKRASHGGRLKFVQGVYEFASELVDPAKWKTGSTNLKLQEISAASLGEITAWPDEIGRVLQGVKDPAAKVDLIVRLVSTTERVNGSFMNTFDDLAAWDQAKPVLRGLLGTGTKGKTFEALANVWIPGGYKAEAARAGITKLHKQVENLIRYGVPTAPKSAAAKASGRAALRQMGFEDFMEQVRKITEKTLQTGPLNPKDPVAYGFAAQAIGEAATMNRAGRRVTKLVSDVAPKTLEALKSVSGGLWAKSGEDLLAVAKLFDELGMPMHQRKRVTGALDELAAGLAVLSDDLSGYSALIPRQLMASFDQKVGKIVKETAGYSELTSSPSYDHGRWIVQSVMRNINASLIYGLVVAKPQMFTNIWLGNMAQIWGGPAKGLTGRAALKEGARFLVYAPLEMASHIPHVGKHIDARRAAMAEKLGVPMHRVLPTLTSVFYNPHLARFYDSDLAANAAKVEGTDFTYGEMRRWARDQGVLTSFASSSGLHDTLRRTPQYEANRRWWDNAFGKAWDYTKLYPEMMDGIEQRMRVSLFSDLLTKGYSPDEAGRAVRESLYDWNSPMSSLEAAVAQNIFMFWGFTRRALNQSMRIVTSTMDEAAEDSALDIFLKSSAGMSYLTELAARGNMPVKAREAYALARFGHTFDAVQGLKEGMRGKDIEEGEDESLRRVYPWWAPRASTVEFVHNQPLSQTDRDFDAQIGLDVTHKTYSIPSGTTVDMMTFLTDQMSLLMAAPFHSEIDAGEAGLEVLQSFGDMALRDSFKPVVDEFVNDWSRDKSKYASDGVAVKSRHDIMALRGLSHLPFMGELVSQDAKTGGWRTDPGTMKAYKMMLPLSMELKRITEPILNRPSIRDGEARWDESAQTLAWLVGQWMGVGKERHHNPEDQLKKDTKAVKAKVTRQVGEAKRYRPPGSAGRGPASNAPLSVEAPDVPTGEVPVGGEDLSHLLD